MKLIVFIGGMYALITLLLSARKYGGMTQIPGEEVTRIAARFGIFLGLALVANSIAMLFHIPAATETGWFLGGAITRIVVVASLGILVSAISWRYAKRS